MYEELLKLLTAKFAQARKDGLQQMARSMTLYVSDATEAQALVDKVQEAQVTTFIKDWRKEVDSEISKGTKTFEDSLKSKYDFVDKKNPHVENTDNPNDIAAMMAKAIASAIAPLNEKISGFETGRTAKNRKEILMGKLVGVPEVFKNTVLKNFDRMQFASQEEFDTFVVDTVTDGETIEQELANTGLKGFPAPQGSTSKKVGEAANSDITKWAESKKKE